MAWRVWRGALLAAAAAVFLGAEAPKSAPDIDPACPIGVKDNNPGASAAAAPGRIAACTALLDKEQDPTRRQNLLIGRSEAYLRSKRPLRALVDLDQADAIDPNEPSIVFDRGIAHGQLMYYALAQSEIQVAIDAGVTAAEAFALRGAAEAFQGQYDAARADADRAIAQDASLAGAYDVRGDADMELGDLDSALIAFDSAIRLNPKNYDGYMGRGRVYYALDRYEDAAADFARARAIDPGNPAAPGFLADVENLMAMPVAPPPDPGAPPAAAPARPFGHTHNCQGYYPNLSNWLNEGGSVMIRYDVSATGTVSGVALEKESGYPQLDRAAVICVSRHWRSVPAFQNGVAVASQHHLAQIVFHPYDFPPTTPHHGNAFAGLGRYGDAIAEFSRILALDPSNADIHVKRGFAYLAQKDYDGAARDFAQAAELKPDLDEAAAGQELVRYARKGARASDKGN